MIALLVTVLVLQIISVALGILNWRLAMAVGPTIDDILAKVEAESTVDDSIIALVQQLIAIQDPVKIKQVLDAMQANIDKVTTAVTANTPTPPTP